MSRPSSEWVRLSELGRFRRGRGGTKADAAPDGLPVVRYGELYTQHNDVIREFTAFIEPEAAPKYTQLSPGELLFAGSGETHTEIGKAAAFCGSEVAYAGADTIIFTPGSRVDSRFLGYAVNSVPAARFKARYGQGSSVIHIGAGALAELEVYLPSLPEQRRIAEILDTLDEAIRKTEQVIAKLQQMKQGLLHDLLTRGIDENGELRDPERHPEQFRDSELGRIPREWEVSTLGALSNVVRGSTPRPAKDPRFFDGDYVPWITVGLLARDEWPYLEATDSCLTRLGSTFSRYLEPGTLVLSNSGFGCGVPKVLGIGGCANDGIAAFLDLSSTSDCLFLYYWLRSQTVTLRTRVARGNDQPNLNTDLLRTFAVACPPIAEQRMVARRLFAHDQRVAAERVNLDKLKILKHGLADDLLTGRIRVRT